MFLVFAFVSKLFQASPETPQAAFQEAQRLLVQRLKETRDRRTSQRILDRMMSENLLRAANLSQVALCEVHLERANLVNADLCRASLLDTDLERANLQGAQLDQADLKNAKLIKANLRDADLHRVRLEGALMADADLSGADLQHACLQGASLFDAELCGACLDHADLRGCCLMYANLEGASLEGTLFDETTVMPNGEPWSAHTDLMRFTSNAQPGCAA